MGTRKLWVGLEFSPHIFCIRKQEKAITQTQSMLQAQKKVCQVLSGAGTPYNALDALHV